MAVGTLTSPADLIALSLKTAGIIGIGQTADAQDVTDCFIILNSMIGQWNRQRWLIWHLIDVSIPCTGAQSYTIGPLGDFSSTTNGIITYVPRPDRIESAYVRLLSQSPSNPFDFPLNIIQSREDYAAITLKALTSFPTSLFYDSQFPQGVLHPWPVPNAQYELHLLLKDTITQFPTLTTLFALPPEYIDCLIWNLSVRIRPLYQLEPDATLIALARGALGVVRSANTQIPLLRSPSSILNRRSGSDVTLGGLNGLPFGGV